MSQPPKQRIDRSSRICMHSSPVCTTETDTQTTLRATSVANGRIFALHAGDIAKKNPGSTG